MAEQEKQTTVEHKATTLVDFMSKHFKEGGAYETGSDAAEENESGESDDAQVDSTDDTGSDSSADGSEDAAEETESTDTADESESDDASETDSDDDTDKEGSAASDVDLDQTVETKSGKVTLKELVNQHETRADISRRFDEIGKRESRARAAEERIKAQNKELEFINEKFEEMRELVKAGNPLGAFQIALSMQLGDKENTDDSRATLKKLIDQAVTTADNWHDMDEDQRKVFLDKLDLEERERKQTRREKADAAKKEEEEVAQHYNHVCDVLKLTDEDLDTAYEDIQNYPKFKGSLDKLNPKERVNFCAQWVVGRRLRSTVEQGIAKVKPGSEKDQSFVLAVLDVVDADCTVDSVAQIVKDAERLSKNKTATSSPEASKQSVAPKKSTTSNRAPTEKPKAGKEAKPPVMKSIKDILDKYTA